MEMIRIINWQYQPPMHDWIFPNEVDSTLKEWEAAAMEKLQDTQADHVVYAYKQYFTKNGEETFELNLMLTPLNDEEFYERTSSFGTDYLVYALHKGTNFKNNTK